MIVSALLQPCYNLLHATCCTVYGGLYATLLQATCCMQQSGWWPLAVYMKVTKPWKFELIKASLVDHMYLIIFIMCHVDYKHIHCIFIPGNLVSRLNIHTHFHPLSRMNSNYGV